MAHRGRALGEQGAESIHAHINRLENQYNGIVNPVDRLKYVIIEHNVESTPGLNSLKPEPKKYRERKRDETAWYVYAVLLCYGVLIIQKESSVSELGLVFQCFSVFQCSSVLGFRSSVVASHVQKEG